MIVQSSLFTKRERGNNMFRESLVPLLLLLVTILCIYFNIYSDQSSQSSSLQLPSISVQKTVSSDSQPHRILRVGNIPEVFVKHFTMSRTGGRRFNFTAMQLSQQSQFRRNSTRFDTTPLPPPPTPTSNSCLLAKHNKIPHKILLFVDYPFFSHFLNWLAHYEDVCGGNDRFDRIEVICMDQQVIDKVEEATRLRCSEEHSFLLTNETFHMKHKIVWRHRMSIIVHYLQQKVSILLSDLDALWRNDPYPDLRKYIGEGHHLIASRGLWPQQLSDQWGAAICMGFIYIRATPFAVQLMDDVLTRMQMTTPDDQQAINYVLYRRNITWSRARLSLFNNPQPDIGYLFNNKNNNNNNNNKVSNHGSDTVLLLPHDLYMRNCTGRRTRAIAPILSNQIRKRIVRINVAHCVAAPGNAYKKFLHLQYMGMWHGGVVTPLKNETLPDIPMDSLASKAKRLRTYNSSSLINFWKDSIESGRYKSVTSKHGSLDFDALKDKLQQKDLHNSNNNNNGSKAKKDRSMYLTEVSESATKAMVRLHQQQASLTDFQKRVKKNKPPHRRMVVEQKCRRNGLSFIDCATQSNDTSSNNSEDYIDEDTGNLIGDKNYVDHNTLHEDIDNHTDYTTHQGGLRRMKRRIQRKQQLFAPQEV